MKLLMVEQYSKIGGGETVFLQVLAWAVQRGASVTVALPRGGALERAIRQRHGERVAYVDIPEPRLTSGTKTLGDLIRLSWFSVRLLPLLSVARQSDYVYVNGGRLYAGMLVVSSLVRARFVYHLHLDHSPAEKKLIGALLRHPRTHAVIANSAFVLRRLHEALGRLASGCRVRLLENALSDSFAARPFIDRWQSAGRLQVVCVGRLVPDKGQEIVIGLAKQNADCDFHLFGNDDPSHAAYAAALRAGAPSNVTFHGHVDDIGAAFDALGAQINLMPSRREESFGLAALEGMACSCLTITSGRGGLAEISANTGAWTALRAEDWHEAMNRMRASSRDSLVAAAREQHDRTIAHYSPIRFLAGLDSVFDQYRTTSRVPSLTPSD